MASSSAQHSHTAPQPKRRWFCCKNTSTRCHRAEAWFHFFVLFFFYLNSTQCPAEWVGEEDLFNCLSETSSSSRLHNSTILPVSAFQAPGGRLLPVETKGKRIQQPFPGKGNDGDGHTGSETKFAAWFLYILRHPTTNHATLPQQTSLRRVGLDFVKTTSVPLSAGDDSIWFLNCSPTCRAKWQEE